MSEKSKSQTNKILYLDTSDSEAVLKLFVGEELVANKIWEAKYTLSKTLTKMFLEILNEANVEKKELTGLVVFVGPGSFTGLRIGVSFINGLAFALGIPVFETKEKETFTLDDPKEIALPHYGSEPITTISKKVF